MSKKPIIGINLDVIHDKPLTALIQSPYFEAVDKAGGIPILIPPTSESSLEGAVSLLDGIMLIGGLDYTLSQYDKEPQQEERDKYKIVSTHDVREDFDFRLLRACLRRNIPVLGICAGHQLLNIALGGTLIKDIQVKDTIHKSPNGWSDGFYKHPVSLQQESKLYWIYPHKEVNIVTSHHQAVDRVGEGLFPAAYAPDGIIEAIESSRHKFVIGVQWHPERDYSTNENLFTSFIGACSD